MQGVACRNSANVVQRLVNTPTYQSLVTTKNRRNVFIKIIYLYTYHYVITYRQYYRYVMAAKSNVCKQEKKCPLITGEGFICGWGCYGAEYQPSSLSVSNLDM